MNFFHEIMAVNAQELVLIFFILSGIVLSLLNNKNINKYAFGFSVAAILSALISILFVNIDISSEPELSFTSSNLFTVAVKSLILLSVLLITFLSKRFIKDNFNKAFEFITLMLTGTLGACCLVISNDFITTFISLEMISLACCLLTGFTRNEKAMEGAIKYLIQSTIATAVFLFGVSYIYGFSGSVNFNHIAEFCQTGVPTFFYPVCGLILISGIMFKLGCVPFTNWIPDIYEGASYPVGAYISLIPKIAAFGFLIRLIKYVFLEMPVISAVLIIISLISVLFASICAIRQTNIKRLWGYSSILQSGFILCAVALSSVYSFSAVIFYLITYIFMNIGIWAAAYQFNINTGSDMIEDYKGLYKKRPYFSIAFSICIISLAGLPITSGFLAKLYLFSSVLKQGFEFAPVILLLLSFSLLSLFAYFCVIRNVFISSSKLLSFPFKFSIADILLYFCTFITVLICITPNMLISLSQIISFYID